MKCTSCNKNVADDAAVCPYCDAVLDPSLLDARPPDEDDAPPPPRRPAARPGTRPGVKKVAPRPAAARPAVKKAPVKKPAPKPPEEDEDFVPTTEKKHDWRDDVSEEDWKASAGREPEKFVADKAINADDAMLKAKLYLWELPLADKLALGGTALLLLSTFLPWKETVEDGDVLGVFSSGVLVTLLAAGALAGIFIRTLKTMPSLNPLLPWAAQLGCVGLSGIWALLYVKLAWDSTLVQSTIGNEKVWASKPVFGLFLAIMAAIVSIVGTIFGLKDVGRR